MASVSYFISFLAVPPRPLDATEYFLWPLMVELATIAIVVVIPYCACMGREGYEYHCNSEPQSSPLFQLHFLIVHSYDLSNTTFPCPTQ
jgi:hypothetical protein